MIPFERYLSKLSENHKIIEIELTELKLWQLKKLLLNGLHTCMYSFVLHLCVDIWSGSE